MNDVIIDALSSLHDDLINQFSSFSADQLCTQYHADLSQLGWHLSHISFIEHYWLCEVILGENDKTRELHKNFFPERIDKKNRGHLSGITNFRKLENDFSYTEKLLSKLLSGEVKANQRHALLENDYIAWFLLQHGQQHFETMQMVVTQYQDQTLNHKNIHTNELAKKISPVLPVKSFIKIPSAVYTMGSNAVLACDNERPVHAIELPSYLFSRMPVTNAEYLMFMQEEGYSNEDYWSEDGWKWLMENKFTAPEYWRSDSLGLWYQIDVNGVQEIVPSSAASGLSWYEADAFARYSSARLPHEYEWEAAMKHEPSLASSAGQSWEWCSNIFTAYDGFSAYPYERYSKPWFDNEHYTLKGGSRYSGMTVRGPSFRNFYHPEKRHVFAGLRLASDV